MKKETYGIIGLGRFGSVLAKELIDQGKRVIVSDIDEEMVKENYKIMQTLLIFYILLIL